MGETLRIKLNGVLVPEDEHSSLDEGQITLREKDENENIAFGYSGNITFRGRAYQLIKSTLLESEFSRVNIIYADIIDTCCGGRTVFSGKITYEQIDYCYIKDGDVNDCEIQAALAENTLETAQYECLKRKVVSDNQFGFRDRTDHPFIRYCNEPQPVIGFVINVITMNALLTIMIVVLAILAPIIAIIEAVNALCGGCISGDPDAGPTEQIVDLLQQISADAAGCGRGHVSPYLRDYLKNACDICGLTLKSSIINNPNNEYYNTMYFYAPNKEGHLKYDRDAIREYWEYNGPIDNAYNFIKSICTAWNADFRVRGNELIIERKDAFINPILWLDLTTAQNKPYIDESCFSYNEKTSPNYAKIQGQQDACDWVGNDALKKLYTDIIDYEPPVNPNLNGERLYQLPFGGNRFRSDNVTDPPFPQLLMVLEAIFNPIGGSLTFINYTKEENQNVLLLNSGVAFQPKFLIRHPTDFSVDNAKVSRVRTADGPASTTGRWDYNKPFWALQNMPLYQNYFAWENPQNGQIRRGINFKVTMNYECSQLPTNIADLLSYTVKLNLTDQTTVIGEINEVTLASNRRITIAGII